MYTQKAMISASLQEAEAAAHEAMRDADADAYKYADQARKAQLSLLDKMAPPDTSLKKVMDKDKECEVLKIMVESIHKKLQKSGEIALGGNVSLLAIEFLHEPRRFEEVLKFNLQDPEGNVKHFKGPLWSFRECRTPEDFVLRGLGYAKDTEED